MIKIEKGKIFEEHRFVWTNNPIVGIWRDNRYSTGYFIV